jgi:hypothetical protein
LALLSSSLSTLFWVHFCLGMLDLCGDVCSLYLVLDNAAHFVCLPYILIIKNKITTFMCILGKCG